MSPKATRRPRRSATVCTGLSVGTTIALYYLVVPVSRWTSVTIDARLVRRSACA
jgi:hypothetical protein